METSYVQFYNRIETELNSENGVDRLIKICSVWEDQEKEGQINVSFLGNNSLGIIRDTKEKFDNYSKEYGFTMNYTNLTGNIFNKPTN